MQGNSKQKKYEECLILGICIMAKMLQRDTGELLKICSTMYVVDWYPHMRYWQVPATIS